MTDGFFHGKPPAGGGGDGRSRILRMVIDREAPTPLVMFSVKYYDLPYGMAVTASHNPAIYNGIKVFTKGGRDADELVTRDIEKYIAK